MLSHRLAIPVNFLSSVSRCLHTHIHTHSPVIFCVCAVSLLGCRLCHCSLSHPLPERWRRWIASLTSASSCWRRDNLPVSDDPPVSCPCLLMQLVSEAQPMARLFLSNETRICSRSWSRWSGLVSCLVPSTLFTLLVCHACSYPCTERGGRWRWWRWDWGEGRATVPIFHPVNKLQKQMDLGAEIHLAPLEWLKPPFTDLF